METDNYKKHKKAKGLQKYLIDRFHQHILQVLKGSNWLNLLDVGCGEGFVLKEVHQAFPNKKLVGVEYSAASLDLAQAENPELTIEQGDIYQLKSPDHSVDTVISLEVLEHLENPAAALGELCRVADKNLILSVPHEPFFRLANLARGKNIARWGNDLEHINHWGYFSFRRFISHSNFEIINVSLVFPWIIAHLKRNESSR